MNEPGQSRIDRDFKAFAEPFCQKFKIFITRFHIHTLDGTVFRSFDMIFVALARVLGFLLISSAIIF
jgi:hypothetical protein